MFKKRTLILCVSAVALAAPSSAQNVRLAQRINVPDFDAGLVRLDLIGSLGTGQVGLAEVRFVPEPGAALAQMMALVTLALLIRIVSIRHTGWDLLSFLGKNSDRHG